MDIEHPFNDFSYYQMPTEDWNCCANDDFDNFYRFAVEQNGEFCMDIACEDKLPAKKCQKLKKQGKCSKANVQKKCKFTCDACN